MTLVRSEHFQEEVFEDYAFNRLSEREIGRFEEHLLVCEHCQDSLAKTDDYVRLMKAATAAYIADHPGSSSRIPVRGRKLRSNVAAAAILLLTCLSGLLSWKLPSDPRTVVLEAYRGEGVFAPAGHPLDLKIDLKDVTPASSYRVEVVDATGRRVWFGGTPAHLSKGLIPGTYWMRLSTDTGELLREYGVTVR